MLTRIAINLAHPLDARGGDRLRQSLVAMPGVNQVTVAYPNRVEVQYDAAVIRASTLMTVMRSQGLRTGFSK